jgi:hypothetical protein
MRVLRPSLFGFLNFHRRFCCFVVGSYRKIQVSLIYNPKARFFFCWNVWGNLFSHLLQTKHCKPTRNTQCNFKISWFITTVLYKTTEGLSPVIEFAKTHQYFQDLNWNITEYRCRVRVIQSAAAVVTTVFCLFRASKRVVASCEHVSELPGFIKRKGFFFDYLREY